MAFFNMCFLFCFLFFNFLRVQKFIIIKKILIIIIINLNLINIIINMCLFFCLLGF